MIILIIPKISSTRTPHTAPPQATHTPRRDRTPRCRCVLHRLLYDEQCNRSESKYCSWNLCAGKRAILSGIQIMWSSPSECACGSPYCRTTSVGPMYQPQTQTVWIPTCNQRQDIFIYNWSQTLFFFFWLMISHSQRENFRGTC
jgi:hypothetical protein